MIIEKINLSDDLPFIKIELTRKEAQHLYVYYLDRHGIADSELIRTLFRSFYDLGFRIPK